jgi:hypothetical protein
MCVVLMTFVTTNLNTLEIYNIYRISKDNLHMNDTYMDTYNPIFEILHKL